MEEYKIREPKQKRSIEKKNKIIEAGFQLFCEKGYHNTNTAEIAKEAGVSTGIIYNYFKDKKDIFMEALELYARQITSPVFDTIKNLKTIDNFDLLISDIIDSFVQAHYIKKEAHEEMMAMSHTDPDIGSYFRSLEEETTEHLVVLIKGLGIKTEHIHEKMHIIYNLVENYCHDVVYHNHSCVNNEVMKVEIIRIIHYLLYQSHTSTC